MATLLVRQSEIWEGVLSKHLVRAAANLAATKIRSSFPKIGLIFKELDLILMATLLVRQSEIWEEVLSKHLVRQSEIWEGVLSKHLVRAAANLAAIKIRFSFPKIRLIS